MNYSILDIDFNFLVPTLEHGNQATLNLYKNRKEINLYG